MCVCVCGPFFCNQITLKNWYLNTFIPYTGVGSGGGGGGQGGWLFGFGGNGMFVPLLTPHFYFPLELYVYITLTTNYLAFFIYQLIILWTISINWHRWLLVNNHISKYNLFILVLYRRYINYVSVCPPPPPTHTHTLFGTFLRHCLIMLFLLLLLLVLFCFVLFCGCVCFCLFSFCCCFIGFCLHS